MDQAAPSTSAPLVETPMRAGSGLTNCPQYILDAIYGKKTVSKEEKLVAYEHSLRRWWSEYSDRKNDEEDEHVADSLLYDRNHLPRSTPPPECVGNQQQRLQEREQSPPKTPDLVQEMLA